MKVDYMEGLGLLDYVRAIIIGCFYTDEHRASVSEAF